MRKKFSNLFAFYLKLVKLSISYKLVMYILRNKKMSNFILMFDKPQ